ncbi:hypothetical protein V6R98_02220 [Agrobacterium sp. CCNWLW71]|uniref:hypothetical protein n=1 Tax=unclassified Agrobacterium TaxID=2632611 RepID=UPI002FF03B9C
MSEILNQILFPLGLLAGFLGYRILSYCLRTKEIEGDKSASYGTVYKIDGPIQYVETAHHEEIPARILHKHTNIRSGK